MIGTLVIFKELRQRRAVSLRNVFVRGEINFARVCQAVN